ncbi:MAG: MipA/OmpV family protein [Gammaproteobacteria bacterium]
MNRSASVAIAALLALAPAARARSQEGGGQVEGVEVDDGQEASGAYHWGLGAGFGLLQKAYADVDSESIPLPVVIFDNRWISLNGPSIDLKLPLDAPVSFALRAKYSRDGYEASDSPVLVGMAERKDSFWYGAAAVWRNEVADVSSNGSPMRRTTAADNAPRWLWSAGSNMESFCSLPEYPPPG